MLLSLLKIELTTKQIKEANKSITIKKINNRIKKKMKVKARVK